MNFVRLVSVAIAKAEKGITKLPETVFQIEGMSSKKVRILLNEITRFEECRYVEIGTYKGSTICAASFDNPGRFTAIDNFSEFGGPQDQFFENCARFEDHCNLAFLQEDAWEVRPEQVAPINVLFYDGAHSDADQRKAFTHFHAAFAQEFLAIIDDWNEEAIQQATLGALLELRYHVQKVWSLYSDHNGDADGWWNGVGIVLLRKP